VWLDVIITIYISALRFRVTVYNIELIFPFVCGSRCGSEGRIDLELET